jgi:uncharacterized membrane protein YqjE
MIVDYLLILLKSSIPIAATTFALVWWAQWRGHLGDASSIYEYERSRKAEKKSLKAEKKRRKDALRNPQPDLADVEVSVEQELQPEKRKSDPLHSKWMEFGGGFYGVVAFFTYLLIELAEVRDFIANFSDLFRGNLVSMIVHFFIESIKNFITAIIWPAYWLRRIHSEQWLWVIGAYGGYWLGAKAAFQARSRVTD